QLNPRPGVLSFHALEVTPTIREVAEDWSEADGALDTTMFLSSAVVTIGLTVWPGQRGLLDQIKQFFAPWARPYLVVSDTDWVNSRQIQLRTDPWQNPIEVRGGGSILIREVQLAFKAPRGVWEDTALQVFNIGAVLADTNGLI